MSGDTNSALAAFQGQVKRYSFEPHRIDHRLDDSGRYEEPIDREFPFLIKLFHYHPQHMTRGDTWHERLELFIPVDGRVQFHDSRQTHWIQPGDVLVVDNMNPHSVIDFPGFDARVVVISFLAEFVYSLGSPSNDYAFLLPFYARDPGELRIVRANDPVAPRMYELIGTLLGQYMDTDDELVKRAGCKAWLLVLLQALVERFRGAELARNELERQQRRALRLKPLFDHIAVHYAEKITLTDAATIAGLSQPQFIRLFKKVAGMTFVAYLTHVRLSRAVQLLREGNRTIADVATEVGFSDQSYFDRRFKASFGMAPRDYQAGGGTS